MAPPSLRYEVLLPRRACPRWHKRYLRRREPALAPDLQLDRDRAASLERGRVRVDEGIACATADTRGAEVTLRSAAMAAPSSAGVVEYLRGFSNAPRGDHRAVSLQRLGKPPSPTRGQHPCSRSTCPRPRRQLQEHPGCRSAHHFRRVGMARTLERPQPGID